MDEARNSYRKWLVTGAVVVGAGLGAYGIAGAATSSTTTKPSAPTFHSNEDPAHEKGESAQREADENSGKFRGGHGPGDMRGPHGDDATEKVVTGTTADKIKAATLKAYPGATVDKTEQRGGGTYEAELTTKDGHELHVSLDKNFKVLANDGPGHGFGRHHGWGPPDGGHGGGMGGDGPMGGDGGPQGGNPTGAPSA